MHGAFDGRALRTILSCAANSVHLANLDDDNRWAPDHLSSLMEVVEGKDWAFSERMFVASDGETALCRDRWESVGPSKGIFVKQFGSFSDTNTMLIDRLRCDEVFRLWVIPIAGEGGLGYRIRPQCLRCSQDAAPRQDRQGHQLLRHRRWRCVAAPARGQHSR